MTKSARIAARYGLSPRLRGTRCALKARYTSEGLSPRLRGNRVFGRSGVILVGSIPAPAGEPMTTDANECQHQVYPRACGGTPVDLLHHALVYGLSPRLRGNQINRRVLIPLLRSIPAPAGEPSGGQAGSRGQGVYPRACGGTRPGAGSGTICEVYPRACGGTVAGATSRAVASGLSPRLRGNPLEKPDAREETRSIPAPAGEPTLPARTRWHYRVYPRACGEPASRAGSRAALSVYPRACGGTSPWQRPALQVGSIPAPAGEPSHRWAPAPNRTVYPRACGGTLSGGCWACPAMGLSPRLRGNPMKRYHYIAYGRSIPAPAGEPGCNRPSRSPFPVYPRACGGTVIRLQSKYSTTGLSPRLRGTS